MSERLVLDWATPGDIHVVSPLNRQGSELDIAAQEASEARAAYNRQWGRPTSGRPRTGGSRPRTGGSRPATPQQPIPEGRVAPPEELSRPGTGQLFDEPQRWQEGSGSDVDNLSRPGTGGLGSHRSSQGPASEALSRPRTGSPHPRTRMSTQRVGTVKFSRTRGGGSFSSNTAALNAPPPPHLPLLFVRRRARGPPGLEEGVPAGQGGRGGAAARTHQPPRGTSPPPPPPFSFSFSCSCSQSQLGER